MSHLLMGLILVSGCNLISPEPVTAKPSTNPSTVGDLPSPTVPGAPVLDMSKRPLVTFSPVPAQPPGKDLPLPDGAVDYYRLFEPGSPWVEAASHVDIYKVHAWYVRHYATDDDLLKMFRALNERGIAFGLEMEPLEHPNPSECQQTESFEGTYDLEMARRIKNLGGTVAVVSLDEPYAFAHKLNTPGSCQRAVEQVAAETADFVRRLREIFPDVVVGSIEPLWASPEINADDMAAWLDAYEEASGEPFAFLHMDIEWTRPDWAPVLRDVEDVADARRVPLGVIYNGGPQAETDQAWMQAAAERMALYEVVYGGTPDHVIFQSWEDLPKHVLPDDNPDSFTGLINRYFGDRTAIALADPSATGLGGLAIDGRLTTMAGDPVPSADISAEITPLSGSPQTLKLEGTVPETATSVVLAVRANVENAGPGPVDVRIYNISFTAGVAAENTVSDPDFSGGMTHWGPYGTGTVTALRSDQGTGRMLQLTADPEQEIFVDSTRFPVVAGQGYQLSVTASIPEASIGTALVAVVFLDKTETEFVRHELRLNPTPLGVDPVTSSADGGFDLHVSDLDPGEYSIRVVYSGGLRYWPAEATFRFSVE